MVSSRTALLLMGTSLLALVGVLPLSAGETFLGQQFDDPYATQGQGLPSFPVYKGGSGQQQIGGTGVHAGLPADYTRNPVWRTWSRLPFSPTGTYDTVPGSQDQQQQQKGLDGYQDLNQQQSFSDGKGSFDPGQHQSGQPGQFFQQLQQDKTYQQAREYNQKEMKQYDQLEQGNVGNPQQLQDFKQQYEKEFPEYLDEQQAGHTPVCRPVEWSANAHADVVHSLRQQLYNYDKNKYFEALGVAKITAIGTKEAFNVKGGLSVEARKNVIVERLHQLRRYYQIHLMRWLDSRWLQTNEQSGLARTHADKAIYRRTIQLLPRNNSAAITALKGMVKTDVDYMFGSMIKAVSEARSHDTITMLARSNWLANHLACQWEVSFDSSTR